MAAIVLVHGIDNEQLTPDGVEAEWLPALAGGVRLAGRPDLADRLWPPRSRPDAIECRSAYYGDLFRTPDQQGGATDIRELTPEQAAFAEGLALEWLERIAERAPASSADGAQARFALDLARDPEQVEAQGIGNIERQVLKTLACNAWLARAGMAFAERFVVTALVQVTRYLSDELIRALAQQRVLDLVEDDTRVLIGHSLGSVLRMRAPTASAAAPPLDAGLAIRAADDRHQAPLAAAVVPAEGGPMGERRRSRRRRRHRAGPPPALRRRPARLVAVRGRPRGQRVFTP
jgi:hypothetical protein